MSTQRRGMFRAVVVAGAALTACDRGTSAETPAGATTVVVEVEPAMAASSAEPPATASAPPAAPPATAAVAPSVTASASSAPPRPSASTAAKPCPPGSERPFPPCFYIL